jgi:hypothetical protein
VQKRETLAQLIRRTVFEFEQRQASRLLIESYLEDDVNTSIPTSKQPLPKKKSKPKRPHPKKKTA